VRFRFRSDLGGEQERRAVEAALSGVSLSPVATVWDDEESAPYLETIIHGTPAEVGAQTVVLASATIRAMGMGDGKRFTFHVRGEVDMPRWRRMNRAVLKEMSRGNLLARWFGRSHLRKLDAEDSR